MSTIQVDPQLWRERLSGKDSERHWAKLVADKPRLATVLKAIDEGDDSFYLLWKRFNSPGVGDRLKDLLALDAVTVEVVHTGMRRKKAYRLTPLGKRLLVQ